MYHSDSQFSMAILPVVNLNASALELHIKLAKGMSHQFELLCVEFKWMQY